MTRPRFLVLDERAWPDGKAALRRAIRNALAAARDGRLEFDRRSASLRIMADDGEADEHDHRPDLTAGHGDDIVVQHHVRPDMSEEAMVRTVLEALDRPHADLPVKDGMLLQLQAVAAMAQNDTDHVTVSSPVPWQDLKILLEEPLRSLTQVTLAPGEQSRIIENRSTLVEIDPDVAAALPDVVHAALDGTTLKLSPLSVEGSREGFVFTRNVRTCQRTGGLPDAMQALRILASLRLSNRQARP